MKTFDLKQRAIAASLTVAVLLGVGISPTAHAASIGRSMKAMKTAYNDAMSASSMDEFKQAMTTLQSRAQDARSVEFDGSTDDQATYRQGMSALQQEISTAMDAGDLDSAKAALLRIRAIEKRYHSTLR